MKTKKPASIPSLSKKTLSNLSQIQLAMRQGGYSWTRPGGYPNKTLGNGNTCPGHVTCYTCVAC